SSTRLAASAKARPAERGGTATEVTGRGGHVPGAVAALLPSRRLSGRAVAAPLPPRPLSGRSDRRGVAPSRSRQRREQPRSRRLGRLSVRSSRRSSRWRSSPPRRRRRRRARGGRPAGRGGSWPAPYDRSTCPEGAPRAVTSPSPFRGSTRRSGVRAALHGVVEAERAGPVLRRSPARPLSCGA
ncbi:MAG: hypothetical protein QOJ46_2442, partial [bacterium]